MISHSLAKDLNISTQRLPTPITIQGANSQQSDTHIIAPRITINIPAYTHHKKHITLTFTCQALVTNSQFDILLGLPFIQHWNLVHHHCNHTIIFISPSADHITIPLLHSSPRKPCRHNNCPFINIHSPRPHTHSPPHTPKFSYSHMKHLYPNQVHHSTPNIPSHPTFQDAQIVSHHINAPWHNPFLLSNTLSNNSNNLPSSSMPQLTSLTTICTPKQFMRHARHPESQVYIAMCIHTTPTKHETTSDTPETQHFRQYALYRYPQLFPESLPQHPPPPGRIQHAIDLIPNHTIPKRKLYRQTHEELAETKRQIDEYLMANQITPSTSPFGSPILLVKKKDGTMRMCVDYRGLNDITIKNTFPIPRVDDLHDQLAHAKYFTKLDLFTGYHQIPIKSSDQYKTAFISRYGTYEFKVMPFGLSNAPATFQSAMHSLFHDLLDKFVIVYLDDILIYSSTIQQHQQHLDIVLNRLATHKWYCKLKKCDFAQTSVEYLGHIISNGTIQIDPSKMKTVTQWATPFKNVKEVQSFLGLIGYYRKFIKDFSAIAQPLHDLTKKDIQFNWTDAHTTSVNTLKRAISTPPCLTIFSPHRKTFLTTDASDHAAGAVLSQIHNNKEHPVAFISKSFTELERRYTNWEKELFAIIWAIKYLRPYLLSIHFTIRSDNKPSLQLIDSHALKLSTSASNRVIRWLMQLQPYNYTTQFQPGRLNVVADALSRFPFVTHLFPDDHTNASFCQQHVITFPTSSFHKHFLEAYKRHPTFQNIYNALRNGDYHPRYSINNNLITTRETPYRTLLPPDKILRQTIFQELHDTPLHGHPGFHKMLHYVQRHFVGPHIRSDILDFVTTCPSCQIAKPRTTKPLGTIMPLQPPEDPWQDISMDLITQLPNSYNHDAIFVIVDRFTKMAHFIPTTTNADAPQLAKLFLDNIVRLHGFPRSIISDRDTRFRSLFWQELFALTDTTLRFSTANHPQTDGQTERTNRTLEQYLRIFTRYKPAQWSTYITLAEIAYNNSTHTSTGFSPYYLTYQRHINLPLDFAITDIHSKNAAVEQLLNDRQHILKTARQHLAQTNDNMIKHNTHKNTPIAFNINDQVLVHKSAFRTQHHIKDINKFDDRWHGPYTITRIINPNAFQLDFPPSFKTHNVINISFLRPYKTSLHFPRLHPDLLNPSSEQTDNTDDNNDTYEAESILKYRLRQTHPQWHPKLTKEQQFKITQDPNNYEFLIKWKGYHNHENTWEPFDNITTSPELIHEFIIQKSLPRHWNIQPKQRPSTTDTATSLNHTSHIEDNVFFDPPVDVMANNAHNHDVEELIDN